MRIGIFTALEEESRSFLQHAESCVQVGDFTVWKLDIGAVIQNMLLEAEHYDIGSCWIGINKEQEKIIKKEFSVPDDLRIISMVSFGYKGEEKENNDYFEPEKIHYEKY